MCSCSGPAGCILSIFLSSHYIYVCLRCLAHSLPSPSSEYTGWLLYFGQNDVAVFPHPFSPLGPHYRVCVLHRQSLCKTTLRQWKCRGTFSNLQCFAWSTAQHISYSGHSETICNMGHSSVPAYRLNAVCAIRMEERCLRHSSPYGRPEFLL